MGKLVIALVLALTALVFYTRQFLNTPYDWILLYIAILTMAMFTPDHYVTGVTRIALKYYRNAQEYKSRWN